MNLIFVCMGTGVVPFISMLERIKLAKIPARVAMFFGVRNDANMFYYRELLTEFFANQANSTLHLQCSREISGTEYPGVVKGKGYVQSALEKYDLPGDGDCHVLICGNKNALGKVAMDSLKLSQEKLARMREEGRILMELWNE